MLAGREFAQAVLQARGLFFSADSACDSVFGVGITHQKIIAFKFVEQEYHFLAIFVKFPADHQGDTMSERSQIVNLLFFELPGDSVQRLIGKIIGGNTTSSFKDLHQLAAKNQILFRSTASIIIQTRQKPFEFFDGQVLHQRSSSA